MLSEGVLAYCAHALSQATCGDVDGAALVTVESLPHPRRIPDRKNVVAASEDRWSIVCPFEEWTGDRMIPSIELKCNRYYSKHLIDDSFIKL
jgi:hypothetical protein